MSASAPLSMVHDETSMGEWHLLHVSAMGKMSELAAALMARDWAQVDRACRWVYEVLRPHNEAEEREILPLLDELGAEALCDQLIGDHREMWDLTLKLLAANDGGVVKDASGYQESARKLMDLIRQHIDTEEHVMLPLLKGKSLYMGDEVNQDGYLILEKRLLAPETWSFVVQAPMVARGRKPGQFLMVATLFTAQRYEQRAVTATGQLGEHLGLGAAQQKRADAGDQAPAGERVRGLIVAFGKLGAVAQHAGHGEGHEAPQVQEPVFDGGAGER